MSLTTDSNTLGTVEEPFEFHSSRSSARSKRQPSIVPLYNTHHIQFQIDDASALVSKWMDRYQSLTGTKWITTRTSSKSTTTKASEMIPSAIIAPMHLTTDTSFQKSISQNGSHVLQKKNPDIATESDNHRYKDRRQHRLEEMNDSQSVLLEWTVRYMEHVERRVIDHTRGRLIDAF